MMMLILIPVIESQFHVQYLILQFLPDPVEHCTVIRLELFVLPAKNLYTYLMQFSDVHLFSLIGCILL